MLIKDRLGYALDYVPRCDALLDLGCNKGEFTVKYLAKAKRVYGIDYSIDGIRDAKKKFRNNKRLTFKTGVAEKIPFPDSFFDVITMTETFEHVMDEKKSMKEVYRVLKPNGTLIFSVPYKGMFRFLDAFNMKFYFPKLYKWWKGDRYNPNIYKEAPWHRHYSLKDLEKHFSKRFVIEKKHRGGLFIFPLFWFINDGIYWKLFDKPPKPLIIIHNFISNLDYTIPYGPIAFNIVLKARSLKK